MFTEHLRWVKAVNPASAACTPPQLLKTESETEEHRKDVKPSTSWATDFCGQITGYEFLIHTREKCSNKKVKEARKGLFYRKQVCIKGRYALASSLLLNQIYS